MNLFVKGNFYMSMFSQHHIQTLITLLVLGIIIIALPYFMNNKLRINYFKLIGVIFVFYKIFDIYYRNVIEKFPVYNSLPLNICNVTVVLAGIYLYNRSRALYNVIYYTFFTYITVLIIPGNFYYSTSIYITIFLFGHAAQLYTLLIGKIYFKEKVTKRGIYLPITIYIVMSLFARFIVNPRLGTNFMYVSDYIMPFLSFIKPMDLYAIVYVSIIIFSMFVMRLFVRNKK